MELPWFPTKRKCFDCVSLKLSKWWIQRFLNIFCNVSSLICILNRLTNATRCCCKKKKIITTPVLFMYTPFCSLFKNKISYNQNYARSNRLISREYIEFYVELIKQGRITGRGGGRKPPAGCECLELGVCREIFLIRPNLFHVIILFFGDNGRICDPCMYQHFWNSAKIGDLQPIIIPNLL